MEASEGGKGHMIIPASKGIEGLRKAALNNWIEELHQHTDPNKSLPHGERIIFPAENQVLDNRRQVVFEKGIPMTINRQGLIRYMGWSIYRIVNALDIAEEFTPYIPKPFSQVSERHEIRKGCWPCEKPEKPLHLYVEGVVLLFGGMAMEDKKTVRKAAPKEGKCLHQAAHTDFSNSTFEHLNRCELLNGLVKPFAVNIAVEDERKIYVGKPERTIKFKTNEILLVGGDTVHGGVSYIFDPNHDPVQYHPSLHFVFGSRRFKKDENAVSLSFRAGDYLPSAYAGNLTNDQIKKFWGEMLDKLDEVSVTTFTSARKDVGNWVCKRVHESVTKWDHMNNKVKKQKKRRKTNY